ncbi:response regulator [Filobacillus milosensis]|uniref:Response regulator n=1 Tax=Filobacillus milosensis TaxID=94137 RepID=A0A4Y8ISN7_9BACI|nr:response regulator [Filobacillus milosensis]TFB24958.1 response regulator [Filobacillus milosensis]
MRKVLIADDSRFMRCWLKNLVEQNGYLVVAEASNGQEAVESYVNYQPDIVLLDITMEKKDGLLALKEIISSDPYANVIMCSSMGAQSIIIEALNYGARDFIVKPYFHKLIDILNKVEFKQVRAN